MLKFCSNSSWLQGQWTKLCPSSALKIQVAGVKWYYPKEPLDTSDWPEENQRKLRVMEKTPLFRGMKPPKMRKMLILLRGPELVHNELIYKGFGVKALLGGRLKFEHFEAIRISVNKKLDTSRMFAIWRVDAPWQPLAKRGPGKTMGGGKGAIHHFCTPVRADRIIVELAGDVHKVEAEKILGHVVEALPFPARLVSQKDLEAERANEEWVKENNINPYNMEYVIRNNMGGCNNFLSKYDYKWLGRYK